MTLKIMMVDDEPDAQLLFRQNFRREIRKNQYEFLFAETAQDALTILGAAEAPEVIVVLSDINMPGMTGLELLDRVKASSPGLPVIMITAYGDAGTETDARQRGADLLLSKPVDFAQLKDALVGIAGQSAP